MSQLLGKLNTFLNPDSVFRERVLAALAAVQHPELRSVIDTIETKMNEKEAIAFYEVLSETRQELAYYVGAKLHMTGSSTEVVDRIAPCLLFTDESFRVGLPFILGKALEVAHPEYKFEERVTPGRLEFRRTVF